MVTIDYYSKTLGEASNTALSKFRESPLAYYDWVTGIDKEPTDTMHDGTAFHCALLEPSKFSQTYITIPDIQLNRKGSKRRLLDMVEETVGASLDNVLDPEALTADDLRLAIRAGVMSLGRNIVTDEWIETTRKMVDSLNAPCHKLQRNIVAQGVKEHVVRWTDPTTGLRCKAKLDSWASQLGIEADIKRTTRITERDFRFACYDHQKSYLFQRAFYRRGLIANGHDVRWQTFICAYPDRPYYWASYTVPDGVIDACDNRITADLIRLAECIEKNEWATINGGEPVELQINAEAIT